MIHVMEGETTRGRNDSGRNDSGRTGKWAKRPVTINTIENHWANHAVNRVWFGNNA